MKLDLQKEARALRKNGFSINEISEKTGTSKSSVSIWVRDVILSKKAKDRIHTLSIKGRALGSDARHASRLLKMNNASTQALKNLKSTVLNVHHQRLLCALAYWCEGSKNKNDTWLTFTNSDPKLMVTYLRLLRSGFVIEESKFRVKLHLHSYHSVSAQTTFWSHATGIPASQFSRPYHKVNSGKQKKLDYAGCASIRYYDAEIAREVLALARTFLGQYGSIV